VRLARAVAVASLAITLLSQAGIAQENASKRIEFEIVPYLWTLGLAGDVTIDGQTFPLDASIEDYAVSAQIELELARWSVMFHVVISMPARTPTAEDSPWTS
jgi:hypothetical protein